MTHWPLSDRGESEPLPNALSYAAQPTPIATARAIPLGAGTPRNPPQGATTVVKRNDARMPGAVAKIDERPNVEDQAGLAAPRKLGGSNVVRVGDRFNDPWMRALIVSPSAQSFLKTSLYGEPDFRDFSVYMQKPPSVLATAFADDPQPGMSTERFAGSAVTFVPTVKFGAPKPAGR
jgi:hypothetical protein